MSTFRDPYASSGTDYARHNYHDSEEFNPYGSNLNRGVGTVTSRYKDDVGELPPAPSQNTLLADEPAGNAVWRQSLTPLTRPASNSARDIKRWRRDYHGNLWTQGSRGRCIGRFCCCTIMITILLLVSVLMSLVLWLRPPEVLFNGVAPATNGSTFEATTNDEFKINLEFGIFVNNPNFFSATFSSINAQIFYPINNTNVGGGNENDITFHAHSATNFSFPFSFVYDKAADPQQEIITDLANRCGFIDASTKKDISISYKVTLRIKILVANVGPSFSGSTSFACPVTASEIEPFVAGLIGSLL